MYAPTSRWGRDDMAETADNKAYQETHGLLDELLAAYGIGPDDADQRAVPSASQSPQSSQSAPPDLPPSDAAATAAVDDDVVIELRESTGERPPEPAPPVLRVVPNEVVVEPTVIAASATFRDHAGPDRLAGTDLAPEWSELASSDGLGIDVEAHWERFERLTRGDASLTEAAVPARRRWRRLRPFKSR